MMSRREVSSRLAALTERFVGRSFAPTDTVSPLAKEFSELADQIGEVLVPVPVDTNYRRRLRGELILAAQDQPVKSRMGLLQQHRKGILIGAAAIGSVASAVGVIIAFVVRSRHGRRSHSAIG
jgi:hypothetical protein